MDIMLERIFELIGTRHGEIKRQESPPFLTGYCLSIQFRVDHKKLVVWVLLPQLLKRSHCFVLKSYVIVDGYAELDIAVTDDDADFVHKIPPFYHSTTPEVRFVGLFKMPAFLPGFHGLPEICRSARRVGGTIFLPF